MITGAENGLWDEIKLNRKYLGSILGPFEAWLLLRGMRTLFVRYEASSRSAQAIAQHFRDHPRITDVLYPGLDTHPGHEIAARQMTGGFGGMLSILVDGGEAEAFG